MSWTEQAATTGGATEWDSGTTTWDTGATVWDGGGAGWADQSVSGSWSAQSAAAATWTEQ